MLKDRAASYGIRAVLWARVGGGAGLRPLFAVFGQGLKRVSGLLSLRLGMGLTARDESTGFLTLRPAAQGEVDLHLFGSLPLSVGLRVIQDTQGGTVGPIATVFLPL
ncbi:MAG TPA: hypothetical protein VGA37_14820 [Gemmatimonadales bacterium]